MRIGDEIYIHGYVSEIRKDIIIVENGGGYFGTIPTEIVTTEEVVDLTEVVAMLDDIKSEIWDSGMNFGGEYQGVWIRYRDIDNIINKHISGKEKE